ncbi:APC family permease [Ferruginibacter sp.]|nr:amino acid permease [Ferruginibacter sp.]
MQENLKRTIGVFGLACAVINITVGTGIFVLPALVAENLGAAAIVCFFICGLLIFLIALCFAEVGSKVTGSGGTYTYIETAFGPFAGFLANNIFWFGSCVLSDAAMANALSKTLSYFFPFIDSAVFRPVFFLLLFGGLAFINVRGAKQGVQFIVFTTIAKLIPLLLLVAFGTGHIVAENLEWKQTLTIDNIGASTLVLFFAFLGIESAVTNSGEFKNPAKTVPLGILGGLSFVLVLYIGIQLITQGILGDRLLTFKDAPLAAVSEILFGNFGSVLIVAGSAIAILGSLSGAILAIPRVLFAGARDSILPKALSKVHPQFFTPHVAIIVYAALGFLFAVFGGFKQLIVLSSAATILIYLGVVLATIKLRFKKTATKKTFTIPGGITVPLIAAAIIIWLLSNLSQAEIIGISIFIAVLVFIFLIMKMIKRNKIRLQLMKEIADKLENANIKKDE